MSKVPLYSKQPTEPLLEKKASAYRGNSLIRNFQAPRTNIGLLTYAYCRGLAGSSFS